MPWMSRAGRQLRQWRPQQSIPNGLASALNLLLQHSLFSLLHRTLQEPASEQKAFGLQEPQAPLPPWQQVSQDTEAVRGWCTGLVRAPVPAELPIPRAVGAQNRIRTRSELVVSVEMSPMAQR